MFEEFNANGGGRSESRGIHCPPSDTVEVEADTYKTLPNAVNSRVPGIIAKSRMPVIGEKKLSIDKHQAGDVWHPRLNRSQWRKPTINVQLVLPICPLYHQTFT